MWYEIETSVPPILSRSPTAPTQLTSTNPTRPGPLLWSSLLSVFEQKVAATLLEYSQEWKARSLCEGLFSGYFLSPNPNQDVPIIL